MVRDGLSEGMTFEQRAEGREDVDICRKGVPGQRISTCKDLELGRESSKEADETTAEWRRVTMRSEKEWGPIMQSPMSAEVFGSHSG